MLDVLRDGLGVGVEMVVTVSSTLSKNGIFYAMPTLTPDKAYLLGKVSDIIR